MNTDMEYVESHTSGRRIKILEDVILGPPGKPEESLVVQVDRITKSVRTLGKFIWTIGITGGGVIVTKLLEIITTIG